MHWRCLLAYTTAGVHGDCSFAELSACYLGDEVEK